MLGNPPNERVKGEPQQQQAKAAAPSAVAHLPSSTGEGQSAACPQTHQSQYDCNTVSAIATVRQADAAEWFNHLAYGEIEIGFVTAVVAALAARWAKHAVDAALATLNHEKKRTRIELRPWLTHERTQFATFASAAARPDGTVEPYGLSIELWFMNSGKTPAVNALMYTSSKVTPWDDDPPEFEMPRKGRPAPSVVGPNTRTRTPDRIVGANDFDRMKARTHCCWIYSCVEYEEHAHEGEPYQTQTCVRVFYKGEKRGEKPTDQPQPMFETYILGPQNTMT